MKKRIAFYDNAKFLLIFLVVLGHLLVSYIGEHQSLAALYKTIYTFHMPAMVLISGHFAKGVLHGSIVGKWVKRFLMPYVLFQLTYTIFYNFLYQEDSISVSLIEPQWSLWFLISIFCWNGMLVLFKTIPLATGLVISIAAGLVAGYIPFIDNTLALSRTIVFFPFFLLGYYLKTEQFFNLKTKRGKIAAVVTFLAVFLFFYGNPDFEREWLLASKPYREMFAIFETGLGQRFFVYVLGFLMIGAFFALVPNTFLPFTKLGQYTLYVYLLHGFFVKIFHQSSLALWLGEKGYFWLLPVAAYGLSLMLSSRWVRTIAEPLVELEVALWKDVFNRMKNHFQPLIKNDYGKSSIKYLRLHK